jgi:2-amino-4-hydroxy-6-hydroxymethyldihydropteridine diphosphokinase
MAVIFLGLGSNLGNREDNMHRAIAEIKKTGISIEKVSSFIETLPQGGPPQGKYLNAVLKGRTESTPTNLLHQIKSIEQKLGRVKTVENGPRAIDIDILLYDDLKIKTAQLTIPHPRIAERDFVKIPLREIAPEINQF